VDPVLEPGVDAEQHDARVARNGAAAAARLERGREALRENLADHVVESAITPRHLVGEPLLEDARHPDEDARGLTP
jgi:hypothetical protein